MGPYADFQPGTPEGGFRGQVALLGSLAAVALTSLIIATMALTSGMIGMAGVGFALYSVAIVLQWCIPYLGAVMPMQVLAVPVAICTWLAYRRHQDTQDEIIAINEDEESVVTRYYPQRTIRQMTNDSQKPGTADGRGSVSFQDARVDQIRARRLAQQQAYLRYLYSLPPVEPAAPPKQPNAFRRALGWLRDGLFGKGNPEAEAGFPFHDTGDLRRAKHALQRVYRLAPPADTRPEEYLSYEELMELEAKHSGRADESVNHARQMLQRMYDLPSTPPPHDR